MAQTDTEKGKPPNRSPPGLLFEPLVENRWGVLFGFASPLHLNSVCKGGGFFSENPRGLLFGGTIRGGGGWPIWRSSEWKSAPQVTPTTPSLTTSLRRNTPAGSPSTTMPPPGPLDDLRRWHGDGGAARKCFGEGDGRTG